MSTTATTPSSTDQMNAGLRGQASSGVILQGYCTAVLQQATLDLAGITTLASDQAAFNQQLVTAQKHATNYLDHIQPAIIQNIANIQNYYQLHQAVATVCPPGTPVYTWINTIQQLQIQSALYVTQSNTISTDLITLGTQLDTDSAAFTALVTKLNSAINGDNGALETLRSQLKTVNQQIDGDIAGTVLSALAIIGGVLLAVAGGIVNVVLPGVGTPAMIAGGVILVAGVAGETAAAVTLKGFLDEKANFLSQESTLNSAITAATGIEDSFNNLGTKIQSAINAASAMANAWGFLKGELDTLSGDLQSGISTPAAAELYFTAANTNIIKIMTAISTIQDQMSGVVTKTAPAGQSLGAFVVNIANQGIAA